jgi:hypothetical protein
MNIQVPRAMLTGAAFGLKPTAPGPDRAGRGRKVALARSASSAQNQRSWRARGAAANTYAASGTAALERELDVHRSHRTGHLASACGRGNWVSTSGSGIALAVHRGGKPRADPAECRFSEQAKRGPAARRAVGARARSPVRFEGAYLLRICRADYWRYAWWEFIADADP